MPVYTKLYINIFKKVILFYSVFLLNISFIFKVDIYCNITFINKKKTTNNYWYH